MRRQKSASPAPASPSSSGEPPARFRTSAWAAWVVGAIGAAMAGAVAWVLSAAASEIGRTALVREERLVATGVALRIAEDRHAMMSITVWDEAVAKVVNRFDRGWAADNIGAFLSETEGFEAVFLVDARGAPMLAFEQGRPAGSDRWERYARAAAPILAEVRNREAGRVPAARSGGVLVSEAIDASSTTVIDGVPYVLTASLIQPDFGTVVPRPGPAPVVVVGEAVDETFLDWLADQYLVEEPAVATDLSAPPSEGRARAPLLDHAGRPVAALEWRRADPAAELARSAAPSVFAAFLVLLAAPLLLIAHERRRNRVLAEAEARASAASRAKSQFLTNMSHELRTPLNGVMAVLHLLKERPPARESENLVREGLRSGRLLQRLLDDLLDLVRVEHGELSLAPEACDPAEILATVVELFRPEAEGKGVRIGLKVAGEPGLVLTDPDRTAQILVNLVGNAVKFTEAGRVEARLAAGPVQADGRRLVRFEIEDTGVGVPEDVRETLFEEFVQGDGSARRRFGGAGLGLSISARLARLLGGALGFESRPGRGSVFRYEVTLPVVEASEDASGADGSADLSGLRVLLVEDNPTNRLVAVRILEALGANVSIAEDGLQAVDAASGERWDVVLMDVQMPNLDGVDATRRIRGLDGARAQVPIIGVTANAPDQQEACLAAGMDAVVAKPIDPAALIEAIARHAA